MKSAFSTNYPKSSDWFGCYNVRSAQEIWSIGHILTINVNEQLSEGRDDMQKMQGKLQTLNLKHDCTRRKKNFYSTRHRSAFERLKYFKP